jgi:hypothetical protein
MGIGRHRRNPVGPHSVAIIAVKFMRVHKGLWPQMAQFEPVIGAGIGSRPGAALLKIR